MTRKLTLFVAGAALAGIALTAGGISGVARGSSHAGPRAARVAARSSKLGRIIVDSKGRTLYLFEKDKHGRSACYGACATYWPPLRTHGKPVARAGAKQRLLGTTRRRNGSRQVTYAGHPLYRYVGDTKPGQTTGEGSQDFGAGWDALTPAGKKIEADD
jgi:predicted lipoprotein with Yx(FWY)xxD motif